MAVNTSRVMLSPRHKKLADHYLVHHNQTAAGRAAGYVGKNIHVTAHNILKRPDVTAYLAEQTARQEATVETLQDKVLAELSAMAFANIGDFITIDADGLPQVDFSTATPEQLKAITSVATKNKTFSDKNGNTTTEKQSRFVMADKYRGLDMLGSHLGMFKAAEQRVVIDVADRLLAARQRLLRVTNGEA